MVYPAVLISTGIDMDKKQIVIVGGGVAGLEIATALGLSLIHI